MSINEYVRLCAAKRSQRGWLWSRHQLASQSWVIEFEFKIHGDLPLPGDGIAFWFTTGIENYNTILIIL